MKRVGVVLALLAVSCGGGGGGTPRCCTPTAIARDVTYEGSLIAADGGTPTKVKLIVGTTGGTRLIYERDGHEIVQRY